MTENPASDRERLLALWSGFFQESDHKAMMLLVPALKKAGYSEKELTKPLVDYFDHLSEADKNQLEAETGETVAHQIAVTRELAQHILGKDPHENPAELDRARQQQLKFCRDYLKWVMLFATAIRKGEEVEYTRYSMTITPERPNFSALQVRTILALYRALMSEEEAQSPNVVQALTHLESDYLPFLESCEKERS